MKVILEFTLPEEQHDFDLAIKGHHYLSVIQDLDDWLRTMVKYTDETQIDIDLVRTKLQELICAK